HPPIAPLFPYTTLFRSREVNVATTDEEARELWKARKLVSPAIVRAKPTKISEDATVPRSKIPHMFERLMEIKEKYAVDLVVFGQDRKSTRLNSSHVSIS